MPEIKRNYKKEAAWEREHYDQIKFRVDKELGAEFKAHLTKHKMTASEWFKYVVQMQIVPHYKGGKRCTCTRIDEPVSSAGGQVIEHTGTREDGENNSGIVEKKRIRTPSPTPEMVQSWIDMYEDGMSFNAIAENVKDYEVSTIRKRVRKALL